MRMKLRVLSVSLKEEIDFLTQLQNPHIARLIGLSIDSNRGWIMTERMGTDLQKLISSRLRTSRQEARTSPPRPYSDSEAWDLCHQIALRLNFLHSKNVVHRDIKPANVLVHDGRRRFDVKITDFGVSHRIGKSASVASSEGTGLYRAPEVLRKGKPLREAQLKKTDVYSFAMTCYEIVTGSVLSEQLSRQDVMDHKQKSTLPGGLHFDMVEHISKCWDDDPKVRPDFPRIFHVLHSLRFSQGTSGWFPDVNAGSLFNKVHIPRETCNHFFSLQLKRMSSLTNDNRDSTVCSEIEMLTHWFPKMSLKLCQ
jgi:serine/threonine protein kinase